MSVYKDMGLKEVINANGKMTVLGGSVAVDEVAQSVARALQGYVVMDDLMDHVGQAIAEKTGAQAGCPTPGAAAGIAMSVAACIAGDNLELIEQLPCAGNAPNEVIIQKGHVINFGASVAQMIRLGGGKPVEVGSANKVMAENIEQAICSNTAALMYVISHHCVQKGMQPLQTMLDIARRHDLPLILDAAAEEDLCKYAGMGVDMVLYSGSKALNGPTSGCICGCKEYVDKCRMQYKGIGRAMKVSKEAMAGLMAALRLYDQNKADSGQQRLRMQKLCGQLEHLGLRCRVEQDESGRAIYRARLDIDHHAAGMSAIQLSDALKQGDPSIHLRDYYANQGTLYIDPRPLAAGQEDIIANSIKRILEER